MEFVAAAAAVSLAFDCFSVAIGAGTMNKGASMPTSLKLASSFGAFQSGMLLAGWSAGSRLAGIIAEYDHWIAFILLTAVACHMLYDAFRNRHHLKWGELTLTLLLTLSIATSLDALTVGFSLPFLRTWPIASAVIAGLSSFILTIIGYQLGIRARCMIGERASAIGGTILILVGVKILLDHLFS